MLRLPGAHGRRKEAHVFFGFRYVRNAIYRRDEKGRHHADYGGIAHLTQGMQKLPREYHESNHANENTRPPQPNRNRQDLPKDVRIIDGDMNVHRRDRHRIVRDLVVVGEIEENFCGYAHRE